MKFNKPKQDIPDFFTEVQFNKPKPGLLDLLIATTDLISAVFAFIFALILIGIMIVFAILFFSV